MLGSHYGSRRNCPDLPDRTPAFLIMRFLRDQRLEFMTTGLRCVDAFLPIHRKVYDRTLHHWRGLLCIVVSRVSPRVRGRKVDSRRKATGGKVPDLGVFSRLSQRPVAVGRALILFSAFWWHSPWLPPCVQIWFTSDGLLRRFEMLFTGSRVVGRPTRRFTNDRRRRRHGSERYSRYDLVDFDYRDNLRTRENRETT